MTVAKKKQVVNKPHSKRRSRKRKSLEQIKPNRAKVTPIQMFKKKFPFSDPIVGRSPKILKAPQGALTPFSSAQKKQLQDFDLAPKVPRFANVVCVEGNIGSGKSTLLKGLDAAGFKVFQEPLAERWAEHLPALYEKPDRWGFTFQQEVQEWYLSLRTQIFPQLLEQLEKAGKGDNVIVVERSAQSSLWVFANNLHDGGLMSDWEFNLLKRYYEVVVWQPLKTLYIQLSPEECLQRIKKRDRNGESAISLELMEKLHEKHEKLFVREEVNCKWRVDAMDIEILDGTQSMEDVCHDAIKFLDSLQEPDDQMGSTSCPLSQEYTNEHSNETDSGSSIDTYMKLKL